MFILPGGIIVEGAVFLTYIGAVDVTEPNIYNDAAELAEFH